jgi:hypothetical protein
MGRRRSKVERRQVIHLELNVTYRCPKKCLYCNKMRELGDWKGGGDLELEQLEQWAEIIRGTGWFVRTLKLTGGEPLDHPQFAQMVEVIDRLHVDGILGRIVVATNAPEKQRAEQGRHLKHGWRMKVSRPGKAAGHMPYLLSPKDYGVPKEYGSVEVGRLCVLQKLCGLCFETYGFSSCALAGSLGRILRINPFRREPVSLGDPQICDHCVWSVGRESRRRLWQLALAGRIEHPSPTFQPLIEPYLEDPLEFAKWRPIE